MLETMNQRRFKKCSLVILLIFSPSAIFFGCVSDKAALSHSSLDFSSPEALLADISSTVPAERTLKAIGTIQVTTRNGSYPLKMAIMLKRPAMMRLEAIPVLGPPNFFLSIQQNHLKVLLPEKKEFYTGRATRENLALFLPLRIDVESMVSLLMGIPPAVNGKNKSLKGFLEDDHYRIDVHIDGHRIQSLWIRRSNGCMDGIEILQDEKTLYKIKFDKQVRSGEVMIPQRMVIVSEEDQTTLSILYRDIEWTVEPDDTAFDLPIPPDIKPFYFP